MWRKATRLVISCALFLPGASLAQVYREDVLGSPMGNLFIGGTSSFSLIRGKNASDSAFANRAANAADWPDIWVATGTVPEVLPEAPPGPLFISYPSGVEIRPNDTLTSGLLLQEPEVDFEPLDPSALHTLIMIDVDISVPGQPNYLHYMVTNIPGNDVFSGDLVVEYQPSFTFEFDLFGENGPAIRDDPAITHRYLWLVYRQPDFLDLDPFPDMCSEESLLLRGSQRLDRLVDENGLGPLVAGNFHRNRYSGRTTDRFICTTSKCVGRPWPFPLPGVNDGPECLSEQALENDEEISEFLGNEA